MCVSYNRQFHPLGFYNSNFFINFLKIPQGEYIFLSIFHTNLSRYNSFGVNEFLIKTTYFCFSNTRAAMHFKIQRSMTTVDGETK